MLSIAKDDRKNTGQQGGSTFGHPRCAKYMWTSRTGAQTPGQHQNFIQEEDSRGSRWKRTNKINGVVIRAYK